MFFVWYLNRERDKLTSVNDLACLFHISGRVYNGRFWANFNGHLATCIWNRSDCLVNRESGLSRLYLKIPEKNGQFACYVVTHKHKTLIFIGSFNFKIPDELNKGSVWLLYLALLMTRTARFCRMIERCKADLPHVSNPYE